MHTVKNIGEASAFAVAEGEKAWTTSVLDGSKLSKPKVSLEDTMMVLDICFLCCCIAGL